MKLSACFGPAWMKPCRAGTDRMIRFSLLLVLGLPLASAAQSPESDRRFLPSDLARLVDVAEPEFAPDGESLVYTVGTANLTEDKTQSELWRVNFDGSQRTQLTHTPDSSESRPQWSADGRQIAFLSDQKLEEEKEDEASTQIWVIPAQGGKARRLTAFADGVEDFV